MMFLDVGPVYPCSLQSFPSFLKARFHTTDQAFALESFLQKR